MEKRVQTTSLIDEIRRPRTLKDRAADRVARAVGSWSFIGIQSTLVVIWVAVNVIWPSGWDHYPFVLMNVILSLQAAYTAPIIMMSQNRQGSIDRTEAQLDYEVNRVTRHGVEQLQEALARNAQQLSDLRELVESLIGGSGLGDRIRGDAADRGPRSFIRPGPPDGGPVTPSGRDQDLATVPDDGRPPVDHRSRTF